MSNFRVDIEKQLSRLGRDIQQFVERVVPLVDEGQDYTPACDISESDNEFDIKIDLPGMSKDEIELRIKSRVLTVRGERSIDDKPDMHYVRRERKRGVFARSFALPDDVDTDNIEASFINGVLSVHLPKVEPVDDSTSININ